MTADDAIKRLDEMQAQIIDGKPTFREIAEVIREAKYIIAKLRWPDGHPGIVQRAERWLGQ